jgi:alpha-amylase
MVSICFYFQVHQPCRLKRYSIFDIGSNKSYFDDEVNRNILLKVANKCYIPMNNLLLKLIKRYPNKFKISFSISGVALEQMEKWAPEVLNSFIELSKTGQVEFLSETYYHSLSFLYSKEEFKSQIMEHKKLIQKYFNQTPKVFRNTELIYNNDLARYVSDLGYKGILLEGWPKYLGWRNPNFLYTYPNSKSKFVLLTKNFKLSDDIAFRFSNRAWSEWPLTAEKYVDWVNKINGNGEVLNLFMDYETFGEHQWKETGIFEFFEKLPELILNNPDNNFVTVSEAIEKYEVKDVLDVPDLLSWADMERDLSAWIGNDMQKEALKSIYELEKDVKNLGNSKLIKDWKKLTTSDHFYYMSTKYWSDGDVHKYFSAYETPYDAYVYFMNVYNDLNEKIKFLKQNFNIKTIRKVKSNNEIIDDLKSSL